MAEQASLRVYAFLFLYLREGDESPQGIAATFCKILILYQKAVWGCENVQGERRQQTHRILQISAAQSVSVSTQSVRVQIAARRFQAPCAAKTTALKLTAAALNLLAFAWLENF